VCSAGRDSQGQKEIAMFGRRRKGVKMPAEVTLTAATSSITIDSSLLTQLQSRRQGITPAHKALLAGSLSRPPVEGAIALGQAAQRHPAGRQPPAAGQLGDVVLAQAPFGAPPTIEDHLDALSGEAEPVIETLAQVFKSQDWPYEASDDALLTVAEGIPLLFTADEENRILHLLLPILPGRGQEGHVAVRPEAELSAAVYLLTINYRLPYGGYTRDHRDGEIRYESSLLVADATLTAEQVAGMMVFAVAALATQVPIIFGLLRGELSLRQALGRLDAQSQPPDIQIA
jgi:hypothetical protein